MILPQCVGVGRISTNRQEGERHFRQSTELASCGGGKAAVFGVNEETYLARVEN